MVRSEDNHRLLQYLLFYLVSPLIMHNKLRHSELLVALTIAHHFEVVGNNVLFRCIELIHDWCKQMIDSGQQVGNMEHDLLYLIF